MKTKTIRSAILPLLLFATTTAGRAQLSNLYPHDVGIESDPRVLYVEKFDDGLSNVLSRYTEVLNKAGMSLDPDVPPGSLGPTSIKMTNIGGANSGGHLFRKFTPGWDSTVYMRYYVKYPLVSKGYIHHESVWLGGYNPATDWPNPRAGTCGLGNSRIAIAYEPINEPKMDTYLYWGDMQSWNGGSSCYGNDMVNGSPTAQRLDWDEWTCVEIMVQLNHPATAYNGALRIWQNGTEVGYWGPGFPNGHWLVDSWMNNPTDPPFPGFRWRTSPELNINYIWIEYYDDSSPAGVSHYIKYDHLVVAKQYIGPLNMGLSMVNPLNAASSIQVYPNPSKGMFTLELGKTEKGTFAVYNLMGKQVFESAISLQKSEISLDVPAGVYFYQVKTERGGLATGKLAIQGE